MSQHDEDIWEAFERVLDYFWLENACLWPGDEEILSDDA